MATDCKTLKTKCQDSLFVSGRYVSYQCVCVCQRQWQEFGATAWNRHGEFDRRMATQIQFVGQNIHMCVLWMRIGDAFHINVDVFIYTSHRSRDSFPSIKHKTRFTETFIKSWCAPHTLCLWHVLIYTLMAHNNSETLHLSYVHFPYRAMHCTDRTTITYAENFSLWHNVNTGILEYI